MSIGGSSNVGGSIGVLVPTYDPDNWFVSLHRALEAYVQAAFDPDIYQIVMGFPSASDLGQWMPLAKTIIHLEFDDVSHSVLGFGDGIVDQDVDSINNILTQYEATPHDVNLDVGIWASARSGGVTSRLEAFQALSDLFAGPSAYQNGCAVGFEIKNFAGATFIKEEIDNIEVFRVMGMTLSLRVYSRKTFANIPEIIDDVIQQPRLIDVDNDVIE